MVIMKITGGLGNQLFQYATGRALSLRLNKKLNLDMSFYANQELRKFELGEFSIPWADVKLSHNRSKFRRLIHKVVERHEKLDNVFTSYFFERFPMEFDSKFNHIVNDVYLDGYWQNYRYFDEYKQILIKEISPSGNLSKNALKLKDRIDRTKSVSLHIRRGDYVSNEIANQLHGICPISYYLKAIDEIRNDHGDVTFFIFSDDIKWCKNSLGNIKDCYFVDEVDNAIEEFFLMKACTGNVIANSTFSWWAAYLSENNLVYYPASWFTDENRNLKLDFPKSWTAIKC
ncbi:alpha-1,2-fucosyltransferase [Vibrio sp. F13]|uniref:alpha-1,2-fucosyltransferase n=1 Tax=Vibrio sp. F13 TaxID=2070777 RepID=UPI0010BDC4AF|nr:alpha-1,2-fucosyltransferase [Vibrio sp. F13]TKF64192.1 alpha-1,2-fucosyltransferase [Vibrio sp. F13]